MSAVQHIAPDAFNGQIIGIAGVLAVASALGWIAARIWDPGIQARGITALAGLVGLTGGTWLAGHVGWDAGPSVLGYSLLPSFAATLTTVGVLRCLTLGVVGSR